MGPGGTDPHHLYHQTCSAGRPRGQNLCAHLLEDYPSGLLACFPRALDTQAASILSRSSRLCTGSPVWPGMSPSTFMDAQSVPYPKLHITYPLKKIVPLPIPRHPWSNVGVDFVTDLPKSEGYTYLLVAVDRFSKAYKLIPLQGLPTALERAEALFHNLFRTVGIPEHVVSDCVTVCVPCLQGFLQAPRCHPSDSPLGINHRLTARLSGRFRRLGDISGPTVITTSTAGTASSHVPSMHKIPSSKPPLASPHSSAYSATNPLYFPGQKSPPTFQLSTTGSE